MQWSLLPSAVVLLAGMMSAGSSARAEMPSLHLTSEGPIPGHVRIYVSDGSFPCIACDRLKSETLRSWYADKWRIGSESTDWIRLVGVKAKVPRIQIWREGRLVAEHRGFLDARQFDDFVKAYLPEWFDLKWIAAYRTALRQFRDGQQAINSPPEEPQPMKADKPPAQPERWDYSTQQWLGD
ncbi:MAG: hypothetical protein ACF8CY_02405 [Gimesia chilikensis]